MQRRPNYQQARSDRNRAKEQKKQERLRQRELDSIERKTSRTTESDGTADPAEGTPDAPPTARD